MKKPYLLLLLLGILAASLQALPMDPIGKGAHEKLNDPEVEDPSMYDPVYVDEAWLTAARRRAHEEGVSDQSTSATEKRASENTPILESAIPLDAETPAPTSQKEDRKTKIAKEAVALAETLFKKGEEASRAAKLAMRRIGDTTLEQEAAAYASAERAWGEASIAHEEAISKSKRAGFDSSTVQDLQEYLQETEVNMARWNAHGVHAAAKKEEQTPVATSSTLMTHLILLFDKAVATYHEAITKAKAADLDEEAEELALHHQAAMAKKTSYAQQVAAEELAKKQELEEQARAAEEAARVAAATESRRVDEENRRAEEARRAEQKAQALAALAQPAEQLTAQTENFFAQAKASDTSALWTQAAAQARNTSQAWNALLKELLTREELASRELKANTLFQEERWRDKALLAEIRAEICKKELWAYSWDDLEPVLIMIQEKTHFRLQKALERVLHGDQSEDAMAAVYNLAAIRASALASACAHASNASPEYTSGYAYTYASALASSYTSGYTSAAVSAFKSAYTFDFPSANIFTTASACASSSEVSDAFASAIQLRDYLKENLEKDKDYYEKNQINRFKREIALADKTARFAAIMKEIKVEEERVTPPAYRGLEESGLRAFETAYQSKTETSWNQAQAAATQVVTRWSQEIEKKQLGTASLPCSLEEMLDQRDRWQQKALLAELHALEESAAFKAKWPYERFLAIDMLVRAKSWPVMKASMEAFIATPHETAGTRTANPIEAEDQAEQLELQARDWKKITQHRGSNNSRAYALDVTSTTARFLRAVAAFKREQVSL